MGLRPSLRFDVFKRDGFACQYCGRKPPAVVLEVDHIVPRADGGGDDQENLITACWDCNRGKAATSLGDIAEVVDVTERTELIREREAQVRAYNDAKRETRERRDQDFNIAWNHWFELHQADSLPGWVTPKESYLRHYLTKLPLEEVLEAMEIAIGRHAHRAAAPKYFGGICRRKIADMEGRSRTCPGCGGTVVLDHTDDPTGVWWHSDCLRRKERQHG